MRLATLFEILGVKQYLHRRFMTYEFGGVSVSNEWKTFPETMLDLVREICLDRRAFDTLCARVREWNDWESEPDIRLSYQFDRENKTIEVTAVNDRGERKVIIDLTRGGEIEVPL